MATRLLLLVEAVLAALVFYHFMFMGPAHMVRQGLMAFLLGIAYLWLGGVLQTPSRRWSDFGVEAEQLAEMLAVVWLFSLVVAAYFHLGLHPGLLALGALASFFLNGALRLALRLFLRILRRHGRNARYVLLVAHATGEERVRSLLAGHPELGLRLAGVIRPDDGEALQAAMRERVVDVLLVAASPFESGVQSAMDLGRLYGKDVKILLQPSDPLAAAVDAQDFYGTSLFTVGQREPGFLQLAGKRALDLLLASLLLVITSPVLLVAAIAIKRDEPSSLVIYRQDRIGLNGRRFRLYKLRTMVPDAERMQAQILHLNEMVGPVFKVRNDPRVTRPGRWIRRLSIDELPQIWNVLRGEMSLVGPRPPLPHEVEKYPDRFRRRLSVRPGITGAWQVAGRNEVQFDTWMEMDLDYIDHWSLGRDLRILAKTIPSVFSGRGAS